MRHFSRSGILAFAIALSLTFTTVSNAEAQYFGRNKVQYKEFKFEVLETEHFAIYFYSEEREAAGEVARMAERWYARLSQILQRELSQTQPLVLYASHPDFEQTNIVQGAIGEGTGGVTEGLKNRVVLPLAGTLAETDHVLGHELVHAFQYDMAAAAADQPGGSSLDRLPLWFVEGLAEYLSLGAVDPHTAMWIRDASREDKLPEIGKLDDPRYFPYRWGQALWAYVAGRWGDDVIVRAFDEALGTGSPEDAFEEILGVSAKDLSRDWHEAIHEQYDPIVKAARRAASYGRPLTGDEKSESAVNVSPSLSPDGRRIVYLSERELLSVDLYLAEVETGRIIRKLVDTALDPHFTSLQFIGSAGSWHPGGRQFVIAAIHEGRPELAILDVERGDILREIPFPALGEILNPAWSVDGRSIAFSATTGGYSDLFIYDLESNSLRQVTKDRFADLQPAWSPDGRHVAFVTDRFSTTLSTLDAGPYGLAVLDVEPGAIWALRTFDHGKSINPQWAPDGRRLYFLSDRSGITNVYVVDVETGDLRQITNLDAGTSGITALSPALSSPADANRLAFSAYEAGKLGIYIIDDPRVLTGVAVAPLAGDLAAALPPVARQSDSLAKLLDDPTLGLPAEEGTPASYSPKLSLDWVGQPYVSAGMSQFGPMFGGGLALLWSDMLGNHNLTTAIDINTYGAGFSDIFKNTGGLVAYQNLTRKWDWGVAVEQSPYLAGGFSSGVTMSGGQPAAVEQTILWRQTYRGATGMVSRPLSDVRRIELGAGYQQVSFEQVVRTRIASLRTGGLISDETARTALGSALNLSSASAAAVFDSAVFGATSPVAGERSRFQVTPTFGSLSYTTALADYRRYVMPARFYTFAGRVVHEGRYGSDGDDPRLLPLFIGYPELVRGYTLGSFAPGECTTSARSSCVEFDRLLGSRMLIGNLEFRFPLLRPFGVSGSRMYGPLPMEVAFFADAGVAWNGDERPSFFGGPRQPVVSTGVTLRTNILGFAVAQIDLAYPFQRRGRGWVWGFSLTPGF